MYYSKRYASFKSPRGSFTKLYNFSSFGIGNTTCLAAIPKTFTFFDVKATLDRGSTDI